MAFFLRAARPASAAFAVGTAGVLVASRFHPHVWQQPQVISCEETIKKAASRTASRTKTGSAKMSRQEAEITRDTALYKAYEAKYGTGKNVQLTFSDVTYLLKGIGLKNSYLASRLFQAMDDDQSGTVTYDEMNQFCRKLALGTRQDKAKFMFDAVDADGSGTVELNEMRQMVKALCLTCHETLPEFVLLKSDAEVALCEDLDIDKIATVVSNRLCYQMFRDCDQKKTGKTTYKDFEMWIIRNQASAHEFSDLFALFDHLLTKN